MKILNIIAIYLSIGNINDLHSKRLHKKSRVRKHIRKSISKRSRIQKMLLSLQNNINNMKSTMFQKMSTSLSTSSISTSMNAMHTNKLQEANAIIDKDYYYAAYDLSRSAALIAWNVAQEILPCLNYDALVWTKNTARNNPNGAIDDANYASAIATTAASKSTNSIASCAYDAAAECIWAAKNSATAVVDMEDNDYTETVVDSFRIIVNTAKSTYNISELGYQISQENFYNHDTDQKILNNKKQIISAYNIALLSYKAAINAYKGFSMICTNNNISYKKDTFPKYNITDILYYIDTIKNNLENIEKYYKNINNNPKKFINENVNPIL